MTERVLLVRFVCGCGRTLGGLYENEDRTLELYGSREPGGGQSWIVPDPTTDFISPSVGLRCDRWWIPGRHRGARSFDLSEIAGLVRVARRSGKTRTFKLER